MAQEIARNTAGTEITLPVVPKLFLPAWLNRSAYTLGTVSTPDGRMTKYLPAGMSLSSEQRTEAENERAKILSMLDCGGPLVVRAAAIGRIMAIGAGGAVDKDGSRARSDNYRDATDDVPVWAIAETARRWNRAEVSAADIGKAPNFDFAPQPPIVRMICLRLVKPYKDALNAIDELLSAKPLAELLDESRNKSEKVVKGFQDLSASLGSVVEKAKPPLDVEAICASGNALRQPRETEGGEQA